MKPRRRRMVLIGSVLAGVAISVALALRAFQENMMAFFDPTQVVAGEAPDGRGFRLGGMVADGTVVREPGSLTVRFDVTDFNEAVTVSYTGVLPDLFREGQGVVALGKLNESGTLVADQVLAKHDEEYMPPEVEQALKDAGRLEDGGSYPRTKGESREQQGDGA